MPVNTSVQTNQNRSTDNGDIHGLSFKKLSAGIEFGIDALYIRDRFIDVLIQRGHWLPWRAIPIEHEQAPFDVCYLRLAEIRIFQNIAKRKQRLRLLKSNKHREIRRAYSAVEYSLQCLPE
jgi:hypothetical protein